MGSEGASSDYLHTEAAPSKSGEFEPQCAGQSAPDSQIVSSGVRLAGSYQVPNWINRERAANGCVVLVVFPW